MSPSCDRGHSGKLIITRATTVALLQTIAMCSTALHGITPTVAYSSPAFEQTQVHSTAEPGTGSNLSNHRRSQVVRVPNPSNSLSGFHQCLTAEVETGDLIAVQETQSNLWEPPWQPGSWGSIPCVHLLQRGKWQ